MWLTVKVNFCELSWQVVLRLDDVLSQPTVSFKAILSTDIKARIALNGISMTELRDVTCRMGSPTVTCYPTQANALRPNPSLHAGTQFTYPSGMEGWVDLGYLTMHRPGTELVTSRSLVRRPNHYTTETRIKAKGAITSKTKHATKLKTSPARLAQLLQPSLACSLQPMTAHWTVCHHWLQAKTKC